MMTADHEKLREAIKRFRDRIESHGASYRPDLLAEAELIIAAAESTLPKSKMVERNSYRVEWACKNSVGKWEAQCDHYTSREYALARYESVRLAPESQCVNLVGPIVHQQEIPA